MLLTSWSRLIYTSNGKISKYSKRIKPINKFQCDECSNVWEESSKRMHRFDKWGEHLCHDCIKNKSIQRLVEAGTKYLKQRTTKEREDHAKIGGNASALSPNKDYYSFNTGRWNKMSDKERQKQVNNANKGLQKKLKNPIFKTDHFNKVFKNSKIGYISKGQREVFESLSANKMCGFVLDGIVSNMKVDIINNDKKIAIEYNGDYYHCNPKMWLAEQYNKTIKMTAKEKWISDNKRKRVLMKFGYKVVVIWESDWVQNKDKIIQKIKLIYGGQE